MTIEFFEKLPRCEIVVDWRDERDVEHARVEMPGARRALYHFYDGAASRSDTEDSCSVCDALACDAARANSRRCDGA